MRDLRSIRGALISDLVTRRSQIDSRSQINSRSQTTLISQLKPTPSCAPYCSQHLLHHLNGLTHSKPSKRGSEALMRFGGMPATRAHVSCLFSSCACTSTYTLPPLFLCVQLNASAPASHSLQAMHPAFPCLAFPHSRPLLFSSPRASRAPSSTRLLLRTGVTSARSSCGKLTMSSAPARLPML